MRPLQVVARLCARVGLSRTERRTSRPRMRHRGKSEVGTAPEPLSPPPTCWLSLTHTRTLCTMAKTLFLLGTGFIGGSVLNALLEDKKDQYTISALCRDPKKADKLKELGVRPVQGELASDELIAKEAAEADVRIVGFASCLAPLRLASSRQDMLAHTRVRLDRLSCTSRRQMTSLPSRASSRASPSARPPRRPPSTFTRPAVRRLHEALFL